MNKNIAKKFKEHNVNDKSTHGLDSSNKDQFLPLSHWLRREVLLLLKKDDLTFTQVLNELNKNKIEKVTKSRLHQHLEVLVNGKYLRRYRTEGNTWYVLNPDKFKELSEYLKIFIS